jgi:hypothetical protein
MDSTSIAAKNILRAEWHPPVRRDVLKSAGRSVRGPVAKFMQAKIAKVAMGRHPIIGVAVG